MSPKGKPEVDFHHHGAPSGKSCYNSAAGGPILTKLRNNGQYMTKTSGFIRKCNAPIKCTTGLGIQCCLTAFHVSSGVVGTSVLDFGNWSLFMSAAMTNC